MRLLMLILIAASAFAQAIPQATGDDFSIAIFTDVHADNYVTTPGESQTYFANTVNWLKGENGGGVGGMSAINYYKIKSLSGVGDYATTCGTNSTTWFMPVYARISGLLPGIWAEGNHDNCSWYATTFGALSGVAYGARASLQVKTLDIPVTGGTVKLGFISVGVSDVVASGANKTWIDAQIDASDVARQWLIIRHIGFITDSGSPGVDVDMKSFLSAETRKIMWGVFGHTPRSINYYSVVNAAGITFNGTQNNGWDGFGVIVLMKFRPAHNDIQVRSFADGDLNYVETGYQTWAWAPQLGSNTGLRWMPTPLGR